MAIPQRVLLDGCRRSPERIALAAYARRGPRGGCGGAWRSGQLFVRGRRPVAHDAETMNRKGENQAGPRAILGFARADRHNSELVRRQLSHAARPAAC
jgi:hypothetical protein